MLTVFYLGRRSAAGECFELYRFNTFEFAPARSLDYARDDVARERSVWLTAGRWRPALPRRYYACQSIVTLKRYSLGHECHFDRSASEVEKSPAVVTSTMILLNCFRPYLSAQPTVGRFALGPPTGNPCGQVFKAYLSAKIVFAPALARSPRGQVFKEYLSVLFEFPPRSQHSCFAALAKNSHLWTVFTALCAAASRQCDCHATATPSLAMTRAEYRSVWFYTDKHY